MVLTIRIDARAARAPACQRDAQRDDHQCRRDGERDQHADGDSLGARRREAARTRSNCEDGAHGGSAREEPEVPRKVGHSGTTPRRSATPALYAAAWHIGVSRRGIGKGPIDDALVPFGLQRQIATIVSGFSAALALARASDLVASVPDRHTSDLLAGMHSFELPSRSRRSPSRCSGIRGQGAQGTIHHTA